LLFVSLLCIPTSCGAFELEDSVEVKRLHAPQFEFGFGLSYTTFVYSNLHVAKTGGSGMPGVHVEVMVKNTGSRQGKEVGGALHFPTLCQD